VLALGFSLGSNRQKQVKKEQGATCAPLFTWQFIIQAAPCQEAGQVNQVNRI
jgi:hypothetical protein